MPATGVDESNNSNGQASPGLVGPDKETGKAGSRTTSENGHHDGHHVNPIRKSGSEISFEGYDEMSYDNLPGNLRREDSDDELSPRGGSHVLSNASKQQAPIPVQWPERNEEAFERGKACLKTLECDALSFTSDDLVHLIFEIFMELGLPGELGIPIEKMQRFILGVRDRMLDNPYHNWTHIFVVTQTVYSLGTISGVISKLEAMECFALFISAMCHDLEHPGVNNLFLIKSRSSLATLYDETSILEKHHSFRAFELMLHSNIDLLSFLAPDQYTDFREMVMSIILATDMARHSDYMARLKEKMKPEEAEKPLDSLFEMEILIKCADTSNVLKPFDVAKKWALRVTDEFFLQGDMERANGMDVTPMCDRDTQSRVALQKGFIDFVIGPFYKAVGTVFPAMAHVFGQIQVNRSAWDDYDDSKLVGELGNTYRAELPGLLNDGPMKLRIVTWNIAAVNNNPFEYWITHQSEEYAKLMQSVQHFIDNPGEKDFEVSSIFSDNMFAELKEEMAGHGFAGLDEWEMRWETEYKGRMAVSGFLKDKHIGSKRLISMPDRITNTINSDGRILMRPSVISMFDEDIRSVQGWWRMWKKFMFQTEVHTLDRLSPGVYKTQTVCQMIQEIKHSKYPAISVEEEEISIPLQVLVLAVFDAVLLHILNTVALKTWQPIKRSLCEAFNQNKGQEVVSILSNSYDDADVIFIQEAAAGFVDQAKAGLGKKYLVLRPYLLDGYRNQNSIILAKRERFVEGSTIDVTEHVCRLAGGGKWTAPGDLCVMAMKGVDGSRYLLASFHGDTNGMATVPVLRALDDAVTQSYPDHILIFGLDANTHKHHGPSCQGVGDFHTTFSAMGFGSCWGPKPTLKTWTTRNARTYLQPQLQKAVGMSDAARKGDVNLKDWIIFYSSQVQTSESMRDNTGERRFCEEMVFPTLKFPSDHAIVSTLLTRTAEPAA
eukprot:CAMPEP_0181306350 /NCGR_PEP_ID=MMETSP1101-20121128/10249_1 /TAXON_ID=46948 /ORGANISM="Rhodomonas abbreviata, Strain Caron Lab Isolate" /LENGTH=945 /DNA_ID=CAMNT_0023412393 /DNA_START=482 /DNA_END=3319 /DNA_ORIENTATION=+